jgi:hypothetical protein
VPRSAFLEGPAKWEEPRPRGGAPAKQKTAVPPGAGLFAFAVLERDGRKREVAVDDAVRWGAGTRGGKITLSNVGSDPQPAMSGQGGLLVP